MSITENRHFYACNEAQCMFMGIFSIAQRLKAMQLKVVELAVFSAIVLLIGELEFIKFMYS